MKINEVIIDNRNGAGATPNNDNVDYLGFRVKMRPSKFLKLAAYISPFSDKVAGFVDYIKNSGAIASPFLVVKIPIGYEEGDFSKTAEIVGHEGRNRSMAVLRAEGDEPIEVHLLFGSRYRARHITPDMLAKINSRLYSEDGDLILGPFFTL
jgi:hypothetical protein